MSRLAQPRRVALVLGLSAALLGTASACRPALSGAAAIVGSTRVTDTQLTAVVDDSYSTQIQTQGVSREEFQRAKLTEFVLSALDDEVAKANGVVLTDQEVAATRATVENQSGGADKLADVGLQNGYGPSALDAYLRHAALRAALITRLVAANPPSDDYLQTQFAASSSDSADLSVIYVATTADATKVYDLAAANPGSFAALAMQYSTDDATKSAGGEVGPQTKSSLPDDLATQIFSATAGTVLQPLALSASEIAIIKVNSLSVASFADQRATLLAAAVAPSSDYAKGLLATAEQTAQKKYRISVSQRFGVWNAETLAVEPVTGELSSPVPTAPVPSASGAASTDGTTTGTDGSSTVPTTAP